MKEKITPFNTGKILIGSAYVRDTRPELTASEEMIQSALLSTSSPRRVLISAAAIASAALYSTAFVTAFYVAATVFKSLKG